MAGRRRSRFCDDDRSGNRRRLDLIAEAARRGVCVSLGHSDADLPQAQAGVRAGARHATHTFNAMRALDHRSPGILGAVLTNLKVTADIIVDGIHVDPVIVDLFVRAKGVDRAVLITDAISATGMPDGTYMLGGLEVQVKDGRCESGGRLAGSVLTLDRAVRNTAEFAKISLQACHSMATLNPARVLGIEKRKGMLSVGADADVAVFTPSGRSDSDHRRRNRKLAATVRSSYGAVVKLTYFLPR